MARFSPSTGLIAVGAAAFFVIGWIVNKMT